MSDQPAPPANNQTEPQPRKRHTARKILLVVCVLVVLLLAVSCAGGSGSNSSTVSTSDGTAASQNGTTTNTTDSQAQSDQSSGEQAQSDQADASKYSITDEQLAEENYVTQITGTFTNTSGKELDYVQLSYNLYDSDGAQIGTAYANTTHLANGAVWKFEAYCTKDADEIASYQLTDVTAY